MRTFMLLTALITLVAGCPPRPAAHSDEPVDQSTDAARPDTTQPGTTGHGPAPISYVAFMTNLPRAGMWKCDPVLIDVNGDGVRDLAAIPRLRVADLGDGPRFWFGSPEGEWRQSSEGLDTGERSCGGGLDLVDINGDGHLDMAVADHCQGIFVYLGDGAGHWNMVVRSMYPQELAPNPDREHMFSGVEDLAVGDVNGDRFVDIVAVAADLGGMHVYFGDGTGSNWTRSTSTGLPEKDWATRVQLADMNGDGAVDLVVSQADGPRVWHGDGKGTFRPASDGLPSPIMRGIYTGLQVGDINRDGLLDFAIANWVDGPEVYLQQPDHSWAKAPDVFPEMLGGAVGLGLGDLDNDGLLDIVTTGRLTKDGGYVRGVFALLGDGMGRFRYVPQCGLPNTGLASTTGVDIADIDGDGIADIAVGSGLVVETSPGRKEPIIPERLMVWRGTGPSAP